MAKKKMTFAEVEEMACLVHDAVIEFGGSKEEAAKQAQG